MADRPVAIIIAAMMLASGINVFSTPYHKPDNSCHCTTLSSIIFLTAVFAWVSAKDINVFRCKLPDWGSSLYEFIVSLFIFEMALRLFWEPIECYISSTLPSVVEHLFMSDGECCLFGVYCPGDVFHFTLLVYVVALWFLWSVLYGYGIIHEKL